ncbi:MAG: prenyltransferase [Planctomycetota bacterium]
MSKQAIVIAVLVLSPVPLVPAQSGTEVTPEVVEAVNRGLRYLADQQVKDGPARGAWIGDVGYKLNQDYRVLRSHVPHIGVSALAGMAFLAGGHLPGRGEYGDVVSACIDYIVAHVNHMGFITHNETRMYSHAFATLLLAEAYGMTHRADIRHNLQAAVDLIVKSQNEEGSWRYEPFAKESDMSITVCQLMALRGARNIGIRVASSTIEEAKAYVRASQVKEDPDLGDVPGMMGLPYYRLARGSFKYQNDPVTRSSFALTAAGVASLMYAGVYADQDIRLALDFMDESMDHVSRYYSTHYFYYYGHYYAVQAMYMAGEPYWSRYWRRVSEELIEAQLPSGAWVNEYGPGDNFGTAVATLILEIPYRYLPIFQR